MKNRRWRRGGYEVSTDPARIELDFVHRELAKAYWSLGIPRAVVKKALANSLVFGVYAPDGRQVAFARLVTDKATYAYLCDVVVADSERGKGLGTWLNRCILKHPELKGLRRWGLVTRDAHGLYEKVGWSRVRSPEKYMERVFPKVYKRTGR